MNPIVKWVLQTMMKGQTGVVRALPKKELLDLNVNITVERLIKNGIDPSALKTPDQVDNIIKQIEQPKVIPADSPRGRGITEALFGKKGEVFDMKGKKIKPGSKIMGGEEVKDSNVDAIIADIKSMDPIDSMKEANSVIGRKGKYKNLTSEESKKILQDTEDHIFERDIPDPEDMATGGRAGFKLGSIDKARRAFLKAAAGVGGGIAALKTGLLSIGKGADAVKNLPPIKTPVTKLEGTTTQMPDWFPSFINKFRDEGKAKDVFKTKKVEVSKEEFDQAFKEGKGENYFSDVARTSEYKANNPDHMDYYKRVDTDERIYTTYTNDKVPGVRVDDMDGNVDVMFENDYSQPVSMNYTAPGKRGPETGRADVFVQGDAKMQTKSKGEFVANDVEVYATDPDGGSESVDVIANTVDDMLEGKTRQMEEYVTGKKTKLSRGEEKVGEAEFQAELAAERAAEDAADEFASGGIARMLGE
jgi:predicted GNAT family acetyltransferase